MKFDEDLGTSVAQAVAKFQNDMIILSQYHSFETLEKMSW